MFRTLCQVWEGRDEQQQPLLVGTSRRERGSRGHDLGVVTVTTQRAARFLEFSAFGNYFHKEARTELNLTNKKEFAKQERQGVLQATPSSRGGARSRWSRLCDYTKTTP